MSTNEEHKVLRFDTLQEFGGGTFTTKHPTFADLKHIGFVPQRGMVIPDDAAEHMFASIERGLGLDQPSHWQRARRWVANLVRWR